MPLADRSASRLLHLRPTAGPEHLQFAELPGLLAPGDLLVANDTRVIKARLAVTKDTGGQGELLLERLTGSHECLAQVRVSKALQPGRVLDSAAGAIEVLGREGTFYQLRFAVPVLDALDAHGSVPLPPYIERADDANDEARYQTLFANEPGAVAAPTAGLHIDGGVLEALKARGVEQATVTLHVGAGTFSPVRGSLEAHQMHSERWQVSAATVHAINACRERGGKVVAVGTTVVRTLESLALEVPQSAGEPLPEQACGGETALFIKPGFAFRLVDRLVTNFHLPESTLMLLVCAFAGYERVMDAYRTAVAERYRFFSYGDAMLLHRDGAH